MSDKSKCEKCISEFKRSGTGQLTGKWSTALDGRRHLTV
jgi:hypothetical protein